MRLLYCKKNKNIFEKYCNFKNKCRTLYYQIIKQLRSQQHKNRQIKMVTLKFGYVIFRVFMNGTIYFLSNKNCGNNSWVVSDWNNEKEEVKFADFEEAKNFVIEKELSAAMIVFKFF